MPDKDYWKSRFKQLEEAQNRKGADTYRLIEEQYKQAQKELEGKINTWYQRFATNNGVSMAEARRMLRDRELAELKWDVREYIKRGQENAFTGQWVKELENASARFHISRLEALKLQTQQSLELMFGNQLDSIDAAMKRIYLDSYYHTAYELQKGFRIGWDIAGLDQRQIEKVVCKPWAVDGKNFSERVWGNKEKLIREVHRELTQDILLGRDPQKAIDNITKKMNASKNNAGRLIMTEEAYFSSAAQKDCFRDLGVEQYEIVATLDSHTSDICRSLDGQVFPMKDFEPGITAPPFHVYCRSTTVPYFDDDFGQVGERAARNEETGKTCYVPDNMTYREWKESFVDGGDKDNTIQVPQIRDERIRSANEEFSQVLLHSESTPLSDKMILYNGATEYQLNESLTAPFAYDPELDVIQYNPSAPDYEFYDMNFVQAHELSHRMDTLEYHSWENEKFLQAIESTREKVYNDRERIKEWFSDNGKYADDAALSDIFSALSNGEMNDILYAVHETTYWKMDVSHVSREIFANMVSIDLLGNQSKAEFEGILCELHKAYKELIKW
ncbi:MAG: minor capsid protein [Lachnospiraceae bacterium]|nr:minor capsid protein [Lachnospiraceae bacterium]